MWQIPQIECVGLSFREFCHISDPRLAWRPGGNIFRCVLDDRELAGQKERFRGPQKRDCGFQSVGEQVHCPVTDTLWMKLSSVIFFFELLVVNLWSVVL